MKPDKDRNKFLSEGKGINLRKSTPQEAIL